MENVYVANNQKNKKNKKKLFFMQHILPRVLPHEIKKKKNKKINLENLLISNII